MTTLFKIGIRKESDPGGEHITGYFSPYDLCVTADNEPDLALMLYDVLVNESIIRKDFEKDFICDETDDDGIEHLYLYINVEREFRIRKNTTVRKNISLPEWMDVRLRETGTDASKLFQNAAEAYIKQFREEYEEEGDKTK